MVAVMPQSTANAVPSQAASRRMKLRSCGCASIQAATETGGRKTHDVLGWRYVRMLIESLIEGQAGLFGQYGLLSQNRN